MPQLRVLMLLLLVVIGVGCQPSRSSTFASNQRDPGASVAPSFATAVGSPPTASSVRVDLAPENNSGLTGAVTLTDLGGGRTRVDLRLSDSAGGNHPAHIHEGSCDDLNPAPKYPLTNVQNGVSTTDVSTSIAELLRAPHAINVHRSPEEPAMYVACGNIGRPPGGGSGTSLERRPSPAPRP